MKTFTFQPATKTDKGKTCACGHVIYAVRGTVNCFCNNPRVWKSVSNTQLNALLK